MLHCEKIVSSWLLKVMVYYGREGVGMVEGVVFGLKEEKKT